MSLVPPSTTDPQLEAARLRVRAIDCTVRNMERCDMRQLSNYGDDLQFCWCRILAAAALRAGNAAVPQETQE